MPEERYPQNTRPPAVDNVPGRTVVKMPKSALWIYEIVPGLYQSGEPKGHEDWSLVWQTVSVVISVGGTDSPEEIAHIPNGRAYFRWFFEDGEIFPTRLKSLASLVCDLVDDGETVLVHCAAGMNRSGIVNALTVRELTGCTGMAARIQVQTMRPGALFTPQYVKYLDDLPSLEHGDGSPMPTPQTSLLLADLKKDAG